jgi:hypothetical protein
VSNITIEDGWCLGGDFGIQLTGAITNAKVRNYVFSRKGQLAEYGAYAKNVERFSPCGNVYTDGTRIDKACQ